MNMKYLRRMLQILCLLLLANAAWIFAGKKFYSFRFLFCFILWVCYILIHIKPRIRAERRDIPGRLRFMMGGYEQIIVAYIAVTMQLVWLLPAYILPAIRVLQREDFHDGAGYFIAVFAQLAPCLWMLLLSAALLINAYIRILSGAKQLKLIWKLAMAFLWWIPILNLVIVFKACKAVRREYQMELSKLELNAVRAENEICHTRYPVVMVHGIFFRDWQIFNYWGRIPGELMRNGAAVYYGKQQSAQSVAASAAELKTQIEQVLKETGSDKVNIIAHSKGGLDSRYMISCLGMENHVASLTTINTPHLGCVWVDHILKKVPDFLVAFIAKRYNSLFHVLGDTAPDFHGGLMDLTAASCEQLNAKMPDSEQVMYQSSMSVMSKMFSDGFPLWLSYCFAKEEGENDGLVSVTSAKWGNYLGTISTKRKRGVSHGDVIDLRREDISGYDVREFYVKLVADLKNKGF